MTLLLKQIFSFFKMLNSDTGTNQIASGIACGLILGFAPSFSLQTLLVFTFVLIFRVQVGAAFLAAFFFAIPAYLLDGLFDIVGRNVLEMNALTPLFTTLYNMPIVPFTKFNYTVVMGSGVLSIILAPVVFFISRFLIIKYRQNVVERFKDSKLYKAMSATGLYKWYVKYDDLYGN